jgi:hypothetical protein
MDLSFFAQVTALAALAVVVVQQILKARIVPIAFANRYPVFTNIILSVIAAIVVSWKTAVTITTWQGWVVYSALISVVAAITYNNTIRHATEIRETEGTGRS